MFTYSCPSSIIGHGPFTAVFKSTVLGFYFNLPPGLSYHLNICLEVPSPRLLWTASFSSVLWVPFQGLPGWGWFQERMTNPSKIMWQDQFIQDHVAKPIHPRSCGKTNSSKIMWQDQSIQDHVARPIRARSCGKTNSSKFMWQDQFIQDHVARPIHPSSCGKTNPSKIMWQDQFVQDHVARPIRARSCGKTN